MSNNLSQYQGTADKLNNHHLIRFRNNYQCFKYYLNNTMYYHFVIVF